MSHRDIFVRLSPFRSAANFVRLFGRLHPITFRATMCMCSKANRNSLETPGTFHHKVWLWSSESSYNITYYKINFKITSKQKKSLHWNSSVNRQVIMANTYTKNWKTQMLCTLGSTRLKILATHLRTNSKIVSSRNWILNFWLDWKKKKTPTNASE